MKRSSIVNDAASSATPVVAAFVEVEDDSTSSSSQSASTSSFSSLSSSPLSPLSSSSLEPVIKKARLNSANSQQDHSTTSSPTSSSSSPPPSTTTRKTTTATAPATTTSAVSDWIGRALEMGFDWSTVMETVGSLSSGYSFESLIAVLVSRQKDQPADGVGDDEDLDDRVRLVVRQLGLEVGLVLSAFNKVHQRFGNDFTINQLVNEALNLDLTRTESSTSQKQKEEKEEKEEEQKSECMICLDQPPRICFNPCGHMAVCQSCWDCWPDKPKSCFLCQKLIVSAITAIKP